MEELEIIMTSDGSHTLRNNKLEETYHSVHGARQESMHVFIKNGLSFYHQRHPGDLAIFEVGFGTGLNALLTWEYAKKNGINVRYTTIEPFPLIEKIWSGLNYGEGDKSEFEAVHRAAWGRDVVLSSRFTLQKRMESLQTVDIKGSFDIVYFDAFAPSVQPDVWVCDALKKASDVLKPGGVFVTYSAKGQVKRDLKALGLDVETLPGPPGKLQMIRAAVPIHPSASADE